MLFAFDRRHAALLSCVAAMGLAACRGDRGNAAPPRAARATAPIRVSAALLEAALDSLPPVRAGADTSRGNAAAGRSLYAAYCVECHGMSGRGDGRLAAGFHPRPADLHQVQIAGREDSVMAAIRAGSPAHHEIMPDWGVVLSDRRLRDLTAYLEVLQRR